MIRILILSLILLINFTSCKREKEIAKLTGISMQEKERLLEEVKITASKHNVEEIKKISSIVEGIILSEEYKPLGRVSIVLEKKDKSFKIPPKRTDRGGCFTFLNIPYGDYILKVKRKDTLLKELEVKIDELEEDLGIIYIRTPLTKEDIEEEDLSLKREIWSEEELDEVEEFEEGIKEEEKIVEKREKRVIEKEIVKEEVKKEEKIELIVEKEIELPFHPNDITFEEDFLWCISKSYLYKIEPEKGEIISKFRINILDGSGLAFDGRYLWCSDLFIGKIFKVDPKIKEVVDMFYVPDKGFNHYGMAFDGKDLWYSSSNGRIYKIDALEGKVKNVFLSGLGACHNSLAWDGKYLWSTVWKRSMLYQIDPKEGKILKEILLDFKDLSGITVKGENIWISCYQKKKIYRLKIK